MSGVLFMALRIRTGSQYPLIIIHALRDFSLFVGLSARAPTATEATSAFRPIALAAPVLLVLPLFMYGLFLMRHVSRDFANMSEAASEQGQLG